MPTTSQYGLPYPGLTGAPNVPADIQALAEAVAARNLQTPVTSAADRDAKFPAPWDGLQVYRLDTHVVETYNGSAWQQVNSFGAAKIEMDYSAGGVPSGAETALAPASAFLKVSPGFTRAAYGIQVPTAGLYTISVLEVIAGTGYSGRGYLNITLSASSPTWAGTTYRIPATAEPYIAGTVVVDLAANTVVGITAFQSSGTTRTYAGTLLVAGTPLPTGW